jgi:hypothetical protein
MNQEDGEMNPPMLLSDRIAIAIMRSAWLRKRVWQLVLLLPAGNLKLRTYGRVLSAGLGLPKLEASSFGPVTRILYTPEQRSGRSNEPKR